MRSPPRCHLPSTAALALAVLLFAGTQRAAALATEHFGNAPVPEGWISFTADLRPVLNDATRVYWYEVNGDATFYYKGSTADLNALLKRFAAGGKGREVVLHAGPVGLATLGGSKKLEANWQVHVPGGISLSNFADGGLVTDKGPALHVYLDQVRPASKPAPQQVAAWIKDLDDDKFAVREQASAELAKQGQAVEAALARAMATTPSAEVRRRCKILLSKCSHINLSVLELPATVTVIGPDDIQSRLAKGLQSKDTTIRGVAAGQIAALEPDRKKAVKGLRDLLLKEKNEYVRRCVIGALQREGKHAKSALPDLRAGVSDPDVNVQNACKAAVKAIEDGKKDPDAEAKARRQVAIEKDIRAYLKDRKVKKSS